MTYQSGTHSRSWYFVPGLTECGIVAMKIDGDWHDVGETDEQDHPDSVGQLSKIVILSWKE
jgi:hypothetical protein